MKSPPFLPNFRVLIKKNCWLLEIINKNRLVLIEIFKYYSTLKKSAKLAYECRL